MRYTPAMSRTFLLVAIAACGSSAPPPKSPPTTTVEKTDPPKTAEAPPPVEPVAPPPPPTPAPKPPLHERLRDSDGPVPGLAGFSIKRTPSTSHCGGIKVTTTRGRTVAPADKQIAAVYAVE